MDSSYRFVDFILDISYDRLPENVRRLVRLDVLDCVGNLLGGSSDPRVAVSADIMRRMGGAEECEAFPFEYRLPAPNAAFLTAQMINALDYDDTNEAATTHIGAAVVSAALTAARVRGGVSGAELMAAVAAGLELCSRLGEFAIRRHPERHMGGWDYLPLLGGFTSAAVAGKLYGLDAQTLHNSLGIAYHQAAGNMLCGGVEPSDSKLLGPGFAVRNGLLSVELARAGLTGSRSIFDELDISFMNMYHNGCRPGFSDGLGKDWRLLELGFKPYACCRGLHKYADAIMRLMRENSLTPEEIITIEYAPCLDSLPQFIPVKQNLEPENKHAAQFSVPWIVACAAVRGRLGVAEFEEEARRDTALLNAAAKSSCSEKEGSGVPFTPLPVRLITQRGTFETLTGPALGDPQNPMSEAELTEKFRRNAAYGWGNGSPGKTERLISLIEGLDSLESVDPLLDALK